MTLRQTHSNVLPWPGLEKKPDSESLRWWAESRLPFPKVSTAAWALCQDPQPSWSLTAPCSFCLVTRKPSCHLSCRIMQWIQHGKAVTCLHLQAFPPMQRNRHRCTNVLVGFGFVFMTAILPLFCHHYSPPPLPSS